MIKKINEGIIRKKKEEKREWEEEMMGWGM